MIPASVSLTGDPFTDRLIPAASQIVWAVRERSSIDVQAVLAAVREEAGRVGIDALVLVLAAMVPDDTSPSVLLAWLSNPDEYLRLREQGIDAPTAGLLAACQPNAA